MIFVDINIKHLVDFNYERMRGEERERERERESTIHTYIKTWINYGQNKWHDSNNYNNTYKPSCHASVKAIDYSNVNSTTFVRWYIGSIKCFRKAL